MKPLKSQPNSAIILRRSENGNNGGRDMKIIATGMLVVMAVIYFTSKSYEYVHPALGFVRAFAEA